MSTADVAAQFWSKGTGQLQNIAQLGPAPRELEPRMIACAERSVNSLAVMWLFLAILFGSGDLLMLVTTGDLVAVDVLPLLLLALAIWSFRWRSRERGKLLETMRSGNLLRATIVDMRADETRGKHGRVLYVTYHIDFQLPDRVVRLTSRDPGLSMLQVGLSEEVLWSATNPDTVVPAFLLL